MVMNVTTTAVLLHCTLDLMSIVMRVNQIVSMKFNSSPVMEMKIIHSAMFACLQSAMGIIPFGYFPINHRSYYMWIRVDTVSGTIAKYIKGYTEQLISFDVSPQNISNHD